MVECWKMNGCETCKQKHTCKIDKMALGYYGRTFNNLGLEEQELVLANAF